MDVVDLPRTALPAPPARTRGPVRDRDRAQVLLRHARLLRSGRPMCCRPSRAEITGAAPRRQGRGTDGKVIYPDRAAAEAAARELEAMGSRRMRAYACHRSRSGHFHLATDWLPVVPARRPA
jgi:hypothetical protein